jgi:ABC-type glycerol-3-phosphate transport system permease component
MAVSIEQRPRAAASTAPGRPPRFYLGAVTRYALLTILALIAFAPFILSFLGTFKTNAELAAFPPSILPKDWRLDNWLRVWNFTLPTVQGSVLPRWLFNSAWLALVNVLLRLFFCSLAAYAFARMSFPGRDLIFGIVIASMAFFRFQYANHLSAILVGAMFNAIPMLILFFIFSKYYMEGASYSGLAGQ